jgi:pimeloyl-ACP methyl ester carboxylesterase
MCARRFLIAVFVLTLLVVASAFAIFQWGGQMLVSQATPKGHFEAKAAGDGPDYARLDSWIARAGIVEDPSRWLPDGLPATDAARPAATFFIHPTTYLERDRWNGPLDDRPSQDRATLFVRSQGSAFNGVSEIWAPKYRQAAFGAFLLKSEDANRALDLAYSDVSRAFDAFLKVQPTGKPLILASHSQGSLHLLRLLADHKEALNGRVVAAYVAGWPVGIQSDLPATGMQPCVRQDQAGCVLSWQSFAEPANGSLVTGSWVGTRGLTGANRSRDDMLCVNPVTGTFEGRSIPIENAGTLVPSSDLASATYSPGQVGARCEKGFLLIDGAIPAMGPYVLPGNNYHVYDYALFWGGVRRDIERRLAAWRK